MSATRCFSMMKIELKNIAMMMMMLKCFSQRWITMELYSGGHKYTRNGSVKYGKAKWELIEMMAMVKTMNQQRQEIFTS